jgi:hypothetical protein
MSNIFYEGQLKADINFATSGNHTIISIPAGAPAQTTIAIDFIMFVVAGATNIQFVDGSTNYGGALPLTTNQALVLENVYAETGGVITCSANNNFVINSSASVQVSGFVRYRLLNLV